MRRGEKAEERDLQDKTASWKVGQEMISRERAVCFFGDKSKLLHIQSCQTGSRQVTKERKGAARRDPSTSKTGNPDDMFVCTTVVHMNTLGGL